MVSLPIQPPTTQYFNIRHGDRKRKEQSPKMSVVDRLFVKRVRVVYKRPVRANLYFFLYLSLPSLELCLLLLRENGFWSFCEVTEWNAPGSIFTPALFLRSERTDSVNNGPRGARCVGYPMSSVLFLLFFHSVSSVFCCCPNSCCRVDVCFLAVYVQDSPNVFSSCCIAFFSFFSSYFRKRFVFKATKRPSCLFSGLVHGSSLFRSTRFSRNWQRRGKYVYFVG